MKLAYLLVSCSDTPRVTNLTQPWVFRLATFAAGYFFDMSGERELMEFRVLDWFQLPVTSKQWNDWGFDAGDHVVPMVSAGLHVDLAGYDHFVFVIDKDDAHLAATRPSDRKYTYAGAQDLTEALLCHELGHQYNSNHANLQTSHGVEEYGDAFCIMGAEGAKYSYTEPKLDFTNFVGQSQWRYCSQCHELFFDGYPNKGTCPGAPRLGRLGGLRGHRAAGFMFVLPHDVPGPGQNNWRYCNLCHCMFFDGYPTKGVCPANLARTGHVAAGYMFVLPHDVADLGQPSWRYCDACQAMFFDGYTAKGVCPASTGGHHAAGFNFSLPHDLPDHSAAGPGMVAPNLGACGWLDLGTSNVARELGSILRSRPSEMIVELAPLRGAPPPGYSGAPVCGWADDLLLGHPGQRLIVEYRSRDGHDRGLPNTDTGAPGFLTIHETSGTGTGTSSIRIGALPVELGATTYLDSGGMDVTIAAYDAGRNTVMVRLRSDPWPPRPGQANWRYCRKCQAMFYDGYPSKGSCPSGTEHAAAGLNFVLQHDVPGPGQTGWRYCIKCQALHFDGYYESTGRCPVAGHVAAGFNFTLRHDVPDPGQDAWRFCSKCQGMFYDGYPTKGVCAQGGAHSAAGFNFNLPHDAPGDGQDAWRFCSKCQGMFYDGYRAKGACPQGGGHKAAGYDFRLTHDMAGDDSRQTDWRYCRNCQGLFFDGYETKGICPATGHQAAGFNFTLPHDVVGPGQTDWRFCFKCYEMYYDGYPTKGSCPAGDAHSAAGFNFVLNHR
jgi:hypothetical protein